ncbi:MAG: ATP-binding protein [Candidatus Altiarchaeota archaeon]
MDRDAGDSKLEEVEKSLRESEELHRITLSNISDAVFLTDDGGSFTFICPNVHVIFGYSYREVDELGNISKLIGNKVFKKNELKKRGEIPNIECEIVDKSGRHHILLVNVKSVSIKGGTLLYTCRDITERKKAEEELKKAKEELEVRVEERTRELRESEAKYRTLVEQVPAVTYTASLDEVGSRIYISPQIESILGFTIDDWTREPKLWLKQMHPDDKERVLSIISGSHETGEPFILEYRLMDVYGNTRWFQDKAVVVHDTEGMPLLLQGVMIDVTEEKKLDTIKSNFISNVSHELKSPLGLISGYVDVLAERISDEGQAELISVVKSNVQRLNNLVNSILDLSRLESGKITFNKKSHDANETLNSIVSEFNQVLSKKELSISLDLAPKSMVFGDSHRLRQVFSNLLENAVKFSEKGGSIRLSSRITDDGVRFSISDEGCGIPSNEVEDIFKKFHRAEKSIMDGTSGTGIGLAIAKDIVLAHGGRIYVDSVPGKGSTFHVLLPKGDA